MKTERHSQRFLTDHRQFYAMPTARGLSSGIFLLHFIKNAFHSHLLEKDKKYDLQTIMCKL